MAYATYSDLDRYFDGFVEKYYGNRNNPVGTIEINYIELESDLNFSFNRINGLLESVDRIPFVPIGTNPITGMYNPFLVEWNACDVIYNKLIARHSPEFRAEIPDWVARYGSRCIEIFNDIVDNRIVFYTDVNKSGIGYPVKIAQSGIAVFHSNWDTGFYTASDYQREYRFRIVSVIGSTEAYFRYSNNGGYSFFDELIQVSTTWIDIEHGLAVRWSYSYGTLPQFMVNDEWKVVCIPNDIKTVSMRSRFKRFKVG